MRVLVPTFNLSPPSHFIRSEFALLVRPSGGRIRGTYVPLHIDNCDDSSPAYIQVEGIRSIQFGTLQHLT